MRDETVPTDRYPLIHENILFAKKLAAQFVRERRKADHEAEDYQSAAMMGLCYAAKRYDEKKGVAFRTFAYFRIRGAMLDLMRRQLLHMSEPEEQSTELGYPSVVAKDSFEYDGLMLTIEQLDLNVHFNSEKHIGDISYASQENPEELIAKESSACLMNKLINRLPEAERRLLRMKYFEGKSFEKMRSDFGGVSKSWLSRVHYKAIESLRSSVEMENA